MEVQRQKSSERENSAHFIFGDSSGRSLPGQRRKKSTLFPQHHVLCVYWVLHQDPKKKESISTSSKFSFSPHSSQTVTAMISISPLAILAPEISSFALFGQLCILYAAVRILFQVLSSQLINIRPKVQHSRCKFSRPGQWEPFRVTAVCHWPTEHTCHRSDLRAPASNKEQHQHLLTQVSHQRTLMGILNYFLFQKYCSMLATALYSSFPVRLLNLSKTALKFTGL